MSAQGHKVDPKLLDDPAKIMQLAKEKGIDLPPQAGPGKAKTELFELLVEEKLVDPTFITAFPTEVSPLARRNEQDPEVTDRFELFITGREIANAFSELNDPVDQKQRLEKQIAERGDASYGEIAYAQGIGVFSFSSRRTESAA